MARSPKGSSFGAPPPPHTHSPACPTSAPLQSGIKLENSPLLPPSLSRSSAEDATDEIIHADHPAELYLLYREMAELWKARALHVSACVLSCMCV